MGEPQSDAEAAHYELAIRYACTHAGKDRQQLTVDDLQAASHQATRDGRHDVHRALANLAMFPTLRHRFQLHGASDPAPP